MLSKISSIDAYTVYACKFVLVFIKTLQPVRFYHYIL
jgi:hypothetical protein